MRLEKTGYLPIESYGMVGDLNTTALIGMDGSVDFLCLPYFDSPSVFAALVDRARGGRFLLAPAGGEHARTKQLYMPDNAVLLTRFLSDAGVAEISDFMPVDLPGWRAAHSLVRRAKSVRGEASFMMICDPRFNYGRSGHRVELRDGEALFTSEGPDKLVLRLRSQVPMRVREGAAVAEFRLGAGQTAGFTLEVVHPERPSAMCGEDCISNAFKATSDFWRAWVARSSYRGRWREMVNRSAMTLKMMTSNAHGSIVASPTFGLPEVVGGERNWDYRYTWIRDASFTLYGLIRLGYTDEAAAFMHWIEDRCRTLGDGGSLQIMYGLDGRKELPEEILGHFEGYRGSGPVRIGNLAHGQLQLDIYGELMDSVYLHDKYGEPIHHDLWTSLVRLINWVCDNWTRPDEGIWEVRSGPRELLYSRMMCWVAIDRGIRLARKRSFPAPLERWSSERDSIYHDLFGNFWNCELKTFTAAKGSRAVDAATLLMPLVKFISPTDPRWLGTLKAIRGRLVEDSHVFRYRLEESEGGNGGEAMRDGLTGAEGTFSMCTFWYVECLSRSGDLKQARFILEKMFGYSNHLGLYSEELGRSGEHLGNFPQAFSHLGLISAAYDLDRRLSREDGF